MVDIRSFKALRPLPQYAKDVASLPYDVMNVEEAKQMAQGNDRSFLRVTRSEIELECDPYDEAVYQKAKENLAKFISDGVLKQDESENLFVYRLIMQGRSQVGIVALSSVDEYQQGVIKIHEKTRTAKVQDRTKHIITTMAQTGPVFLTFRDNLGVAEILLKEMQHDPLYDFIANDGIQHTIWKVGDSQSLIRLFKDIPNTYIADGHHRAASSSNCRDILKEKNQNHTGNESYNYFLSVIFPDNQLKIMPYNRIIKKCDLSDDEILQRVSESYSISKSDDASPHQKRQICLFLSGQWYRLDLKSDYQISSDAVEALDVSILYQTILQPVFAIGDQRTDTNIDFIGGIRGTKELERLVNSGQARCAFSMYPVSITDLLDIADAGKTMAPKSTWFEPKLRSGLIIHMINDKM